MKKNQIKIDIEFFTHVHNGANPPLYTYISGRKNNKVIKYTLLYGYSGAFTMHMNVFIDKIKQKYENIEGSSDKEIIDNAQQIWKEGL